MAFLDNNGVTRLVADLKSKFATLVSGAVAVVQGGTGKATHTTNAVLTGNGTNAVNNVATADGALYATAANGAAKFGTLPVAQGGTAGTTEAEARASLEVPVNAAIATVESTTATANHAIGDHFMLDDKLKTATAAIATGETINATNSADATVQAQIDTLRDSVARLRLTPQIKDVFFNNWGTDTNQIKITTTNNDEYALEIRYNPTTGSKGIGYYKNGTMLWELPAS